MEFWEFLIQQEGDRSWLPLESPSVEILEGRYRVVARSSRPYVPTEVRVTHYDSAEMPPVRRVRKRSSRTNAEGLIVVLPFTRLQPGLWDLRCTGDLMAELMGESWQCAVQLDVLPQSIDLPEAWELEPTMAEVAEIHLAQNSRVETVETTANANSVTTTASLTAEVPVDIPADRSIRRSTIEPAEIEPAEIERSEIELSGELSSEPASELSESAITASEPAAFDDPLAASATDSIERATSEPPQAQIPLDQSPVDPPLAQPIESVARSEDAIAAMLQQVEQVSEQIVDSAFREFAELTTAETTRAIDTEPLLVPPQLQVVLEQETYVIQRGETLALTGRVEFATEDVPWPATVSELRVRLYDPQTSEMLMDEVYSINDRVPPFPFSGIISLPEHYQTYLVLGELIFQGTSPEGTSQVLVSRSFNVTTDLHELIESIANDFPDSEALPTEATPEVTEPLPAAELTQLNQHSSAFRRSSHQALPPQLRPANPARTHASLDLPSFAATVYETVSSEITAPESIPKPILEPDLEPISTSAADLLPPVDSAAKGPHPSLNEATLIELDGDATPSFIPDATQNFAPNPIPDATFDAAITQALESTDRQPLEDTVDLFLDWEGLGRPVPLWQKRVQSPASNQPEDVSFRALNLQDRFLERLQALATNPELSAQLGAIEAAAGHANSSLVPLTEAEKADALQSIRPSIGFDADLAAHEVVVDEERDTEIKHNLNEAESEAEPLSGPILPVDEPIPTPRLQLPSGEMVAGQPIPITIKLPTLVARIYVKLWLRDRQTRELVSTPRWIIDFVPDGFGNQMARTEVVVPPGCLKVQFEAIAVEIATQRESDKASMTRPIVPPDLSPFSLDELEI